MAEELKHTNLHHWHVAHGGRMVPFAGWEMPVQYPTGPIEEHHLTRRSAGLFDIDHMGQVHISGPQAEEFINRLVTWDVRRMQPNQAHYALMCDRAGGIVDDVFVYRLAGRWLVVVNASNLEKDYSWLGQHAAGLDVTITDVSPQTYMLALQGPRALELLQKLTQADLAAMARFTAAEADVAGAPAIIGRTGYTGEEGVELFFPAEAALRVWESILNTGAASSIEVGPVGLAARDSLRFEAGFPLYGHEIAADVTPLEAGLGWACHFETSFIGAEALLKQKVTGLAKKLIGFELIEKGVPRQDYLIADAAGQIVGRVVSGLFAPTVDKYCGHAFVSPAYTTPGTPLQVLIRDKPKAAIVIKPPFYTPTYRK
jgi:glycine cleavage system T protein